MSGDLHIEPVGDDRRTEALGILLTGRPPRSGQDLQARLFDESVCRRAIRTDLWWAFRKRRCVAAAMTAVNPGRSAQLHHSPPGRVADAKDAAALIRSLSEAALVSAVEVFGESLLAVL